MDWFDRSIDLLLRARGRSRGRDSIPCRYECYDPNQLSSEYRVLRLSFTWALTACNIKLLVSFSSVSTLAYAFPSPEEKAYDLAAFLSDYLRPVCDRRFPIDYSSHVRLHLQLHVMTIFRNQVLINTASIAIWNKNKVVVTLAIIVWGISFVSHVQSKALPLTALAKDLESEFHTTVGWSTGAARVNDQFQNFWTHWAYLIRSFALFGSLDKLSVSLSRPSRAYLVSSPR